MERTYCPYCGQLLKDGCECEKIAAEDREFFTEKYYSDPLVAEGWRQQDLIDAYRYER